MTKRILSAILSVCLMLTLITTSFAASTEETDTTYEVPTIPTTGDIWDGTTLQPSKLVRLDGKYYYEISKCSELAYVAQTGEDWLTYNYVLANNLIINDVELAIAEDGSVSYDTDTEIREWTPIGSYTGIFNGAGYSISGVLGSEYFFSRLSGTLKNVSIVNSYFYGTNSISGIVGFLTGTMENCVFSGCSESETAGGLAAACADSKITNCINYGLIVGEKWKFQSYLKNYCVGGIVGHQDGDGVVENCTNYGSIMNSLISGGIVGFAEDGKVIGCVNQGAVSSVSEVTGSYTDPIIIGGLSGGIIGLLETRHRRGDYPVMNNVNYGNVHAESTAGGVVGDTTPCFPGDTEIIKSCNNYGRVESTSSTASVGGIVGDMLGGCLECHNWGEIIGGGYTGGIVGNLSSRYEECSYTVNYGNVTGYGASGGIAGRIYNKSNFIIKCSCNIGEVNAVTYVGGILGELESYEQNELTISNCYNVGAVCGESYVGGISGSGKYCSVENCYNIAEVTADESYAMVTPETNYIWEYCTVSNVYYLENSDLDVTGFDNIDDATDVVEAKSSEELKKEETFVNWDFDEIWAMAENVNDGYPYLQWQNPCANGHSFTKYVSNNDATCTADGTKTATCDNCDKTDTITDVGSKGHDLKPLPKEEERSDADGKIAHYKCSRCHALFEDAAGKTLIIPVRVLGDMDGNGKVEAADAILILKHLVGLLTLDEEQLAAADVDGSGKLTTIDAVYILRFAADLIQKFPAAS